MATYDAPNYTEIPNKFFDERMKTLSGSAVKIFLVIARKTFGWHKKDLRDKISFSQLRELSGVSSNETLYKCFEELKEDVIKTVENGITYFAINATASMQQYFGAVTESVTPSDGNRKTPVTESVNTKERVKDTSSRKRYHSHIAWDSEACLWDGPTEKDVSLWRHNFPDIDLDLELGRSGQYLNDHPEKNYKNFAKFLFNWFSNAQKRAEGKSKW